MLGWLFGSEKSQSKQYLVPGRLEDVLALIQVLAMDKARLRGESALGEVLNGSPNSARTWMEVAKRHREFFRVFDGGGDPKIALTARHLNAQHEDGGRLESWLLRGLLDAAIQIHAGQLQRKQVSKAGWIGGAIGGLVGAIIPLVFQLLARRYGW